MTEAVRVPDNQRVASLHDFFEVRPPGVDYEVHEHAGPIEIDVDRTSFKIHRDAGRLRLGVCHRLP